MIGGLLKTLDVGTSHYHLMNFKAITLINGQEQKKKAGLKQKIGYQTKIHNLN